MKRILFTLILSFLAAASGIKAQYVSVDQARQTALQFIQSNHLKKSSVLNDELSLVYEAKAPVQTKSTGNSLLYVFNLNSTDGFVIVSGDERTATSIIGYSFSNSFQAENMPENLKEWLDSYGKQISYLRTTAPDVKKTESVKPRISRSESHSVLFPQILGSLEDTILVYKDDSDISKQIAFNSPRLRTFPESVSPMVSTTWTQNKPFNNYLPLYGSDRCITGCTATAMGQIMNYHRWPDRGQGSKSYKTRSLGFSLSADFNTTYDWNNMLDDYTKSYSEAQGNAVAKLVGHAAIALETDLTPTGSGAYTNKVTESLVKYFKYKTSVSFVFRSKFSDSEWENMLKKELSAGFPVLYSGENSNGGHMFICDGYEKSGKYHFNWGWGGFCDGYFALNLLNPDPENGFTYNDTQSMIFQIRTNSGSGNEGGEEEEKAPRLVVAKKPWADKDPIEKGETVTLRAQVKNVGNGDYNGKLGFFFSNTTNPSASQTYYGASQKIGSRQTIEFSLKTTINLQDGQYKVQVCYMSGEMPYAISEPFSIINVGKATSPDTPSASFKFKTIEGVSASDNHIVKGEEVTFSAELKNIGDGEYNDVLGVLLQDMKDADNYKFFKGKTYNVKPGQSCAFSVTAKVDLEPSEYKAYPFYKKNGKNYYRTDKPTKVKIYWKPLSKGNRIKVLSPFKTEQTTIKEGDLVTYTAEIKNEGETMTDYFGIYFVSKKDPNEVYAVRSKNKMKFPANTQATFSVPEMPMIEGSFNVYFMYKENNEFYYVENPHSSVTVQANEKKPKVSLEVEKPYTPDNKNITAKDKVVFSSIVRNSGTVDYNGVVGIYYASRENPDNDHQTIANGKLTIKAGQSKSFTFTTSVNVVPGVYDLYFVYDNEGEYKLIENPYSTITVQAPKEQQEFKFQVIDAFTSDKNPVEQNSSAAFKGHIKNTGNAAYSGKFGLYFVDCNNSQNSIVYMTNKTFTVDAGRDFNFTISTLLEIAPSTYNVYFIYEQNGGKRYIENPHSTITILPKRDKMFNIKVTKSFTPTQNRIEENDLVRFEGTVENIGDGDYNDYMGVYFVDQNDPDNTQITTIPNKISLRAGENSGIWANVPIELRPGTYNVYVAYTSNGQYKYVENPNSVIQVFPKKDIPDDPVNPDVSDYKFEIITPPAPKVSQIVEGDEVWFNTLIENTGKVDFYDHLSHFFINQETQQWHRFESLRKHSIPAGEQYTLSMSSTLNLSPGTYSATLLFLINGEWKLMDEKYSTIIIQKNTVGNEEINSVLMIQPDRASGRIVITGNNIQETALYDMSGKMISHETHKDVSEVILQTHSNQAQVYIIQVRTRDNVFREKIKF